MSISRGYTLVRWALYGGMGNYETVKFLLDQGALVDEESYQHVWDYAYREKCSTVELHELECITLKPPPSYIYTDWVEEQQFSPIHLAVFGRRGSESLRTLLAENEEVVHLKDAMGRTALDWATALGRLPDMTALIQYGSPLNTMDTSGRTTVLHAVDSHNNDALRLVLEAGADPNPKVPEGQFRSSPLTAASFGGLLEMMKLLLDFGAEVDADNPEGRTALHTIASVGDSESANLLLDYGADMFYVSKNGNSPFTTAMIHNNHAVLRLFIRRCEFRRLKEFQLPPVVVMSANAETMSILAASNLIV
ncbi:hypothetical protein E8E12_000932 [Didymella heteroderae]|uniref:Uncharacterized protein n=1 Tax=Didymella heteroderae TaxID=1769908 RepID=A0A9P5BVD5_9PLEO|nr:hypothetical protein E8E12_000932 [Didymella heteroderae]